METYQILVKNLDARTLCIDFSSPIISGLDLKQKICQLTAAPAEYSRVTTGTFNVYDDTQLFAKDFFFPSVTLTGRLLGGKGGFGSLLRGAATKAGQKKTNNFDACRDMNGRRLRHVNAEKKLEEWQAGAEERKLEKLAENFLRKKSKEVRNNKSVDTDKYIKKYREDSAKCIEDVEASVKDAFQLYEKSKRKVLSSGGPPSKKLKIWMGKGKEVDSDSDEEADDANPVSFENNESLSLKKDEGCSASVPTSHSNEASVGGSIQKGLEEDGYVADNTDVSTFTESNLESFGSRLVNNDMEQYLDVKDEREDLDEKVNRKIDLSSEVNLLTRSSQFLAADAHEKDAELSLNCQGHSSHSEINLSDENTALDFNLYSSASEMEVLGAERLKTELQAQGLKCGGTLQERAARLFLLKTTTLEKLPKKHLAKPPVGVIKKGSSMIGKTHDIAVN